MEEKTLSYLLTFRFGNDIVYYDPSANELVLNKELDKELDKEMKDAFLEHIKKFVFPQASEEDDENLKNTFTPE
jgi:hypothetical protein